MTMKLRANRPTVPPMMMLALLLAKVVNHPPACFSSFVMVALVGSPVVVCVDEGEWAVEEEEEEKWREVCGLSREKRTLFLVNIVLVIDVT